MRRQPANEHVFYDPATAKAVAAQIAERLVGDDAAHADVYRANAAEFGKQTDAILAPERAIGQDHPGASVVATEPVAHYLLLNAGITDRTPEGFASAVEEDDDPSPADLAAMLDLISGRQVSALLSTRRPRRRSPTRSRTPPRALRSRRHRDRDPARGHRLSDVAAPDRRAVGQPVG